MLKSSSYVDLSKYRSSIMGVAIIWIMLFHLEGQTNIFTYMLGKANFTIIGYGGVDIFLFYSGFGLYYSWQKHPSIKLFFKKRFLRILPTYWIAVFFLYFLVLQCINWKDMLLMLTTFGFWIQKANEWYISAIIAFYLLFPLYMYFFQKNPLKSVVIWSMFGIIASFLIGIIYPTIIIYFTARIPIFFIGVFFASLVSKGKTLPVLFLEVLSIIG